MGNLPITRSTTHQFTNSASYEAETRSAEVAAEDAGGAGAEPVVDDLRVHRSKVGLVVDVARVVLERRVLRIRAQARRGSVEAAADAAAQDHHHRRGAVIGAAAAVLGDAPAELRGR